MKDDYKKCPYCGETILETAKKCRYCGEWLINKEEVSDIQQQAIYNQVSDNPLSEGRVHNDERITDKSIIKNSFIKYRIIIWLLAGLLIGGVIIKGVELYRSVPVFINILNQNYTIWEDNTSSIYIACIFISFLIFFTAFIVDKLLKKKHQKELISKRTKSSRIHFKIEYKNLKIAIAVIIIITSVLICAKYFVSVDRNTAHKIFEYNIIQVKGNKLPKIYTEDDKEQLLKQSDFLPLNFGDTYDIEKLLLNSYGEEGWELVDVYTTTETVYPNFGNKDYVTGLRENVRTNTVNFVFKRLKNN